MDEMNEEEVEFMQVLGFPGRPGFHFYSTARRWLRSVESLAVGSHGSATIVSYSPSVVYFHDGRSPSHVIFVKLKTLQNAGFLMRADRPERDILRNRLRRGEILSTGVMN